MKTEYQLEVTEKECTENGEKEAFLKRQNKGCATKARAIRKKGWLTDLELEESRKNIRDENELDKIENEESLQNYNDTEDPVVEEHITSTADESENNLENEYYTVLMHEEATEEEKKILNRLVEVMRDQKHGYVCDFKKVDRWKLQQETAKVNRVLNCTKTNNITETNKLTKGVSIVVATDKTVWTLAKEVRIENRDGKEESRAILRRYKVKFRLYRKKERGKLRTYCKYTKRKKKYNSIRKSIGVVMEEFKQRLKAKKAKVIRYEQRVKQYRQKRLFISDQKRFYPEIIGNTVAEKLIPNAQES